MYYKYKWRCQLLVYKSQTYITNVENGKRGTPSPEILKKLAVPLEISYIELMNKTGYMSEHLIHRSHLEFTSTKIGMAIVDILREINQFIERILNNDLALRVKILEVKDHMELSRISSSSGEVL